MQLLDHVSITVRDLTAVKAFYQAVFSALGAEQVYEESRAIGFGQRNGPDCDAHSYLSLFESPDAVADPLRHYCFRASSKARVDAFFAAGLATGGSSGGAPGLRDYHPGYYAAFLLDPEGNRIEAVYHLATSGAGRRGG